MRYYHIIFCVLLFSSCTKLVENEFERFNDYHVVNSILQADSQIVMNVSKTVGLQETGVAYEEQATIELYINDSLSSTLTYRGSGEYVSEYIAEEDGEYKFVVQIPNRESFSIEKKIPVASEIFAVGHLDNFAVDEEGVSTPALTMTIGNDTSEIRYHHLKVAQIQETRYDGTFVYPIQIEEIVDPLLKREGIPILNFSNQGVSNSKFSLTVNYSTGHATKVNGQWVIALAPLLIELRTTDQDYYELIKSQYLYEQASIPELAGSNKAVYEPYYQTYTEGVIGLSVAYSKVIADTLFVENNYQ